MSSSLSCNKFVPYKAACSSREGHYCFVRVPGDVITVSGLHCVIA